MAIISHSSLGSPALHLTPRSSQHLDDWVTSSNVHRRGPYHVRSIELLFRIPFIVRQPFNFTRRELTENLLTLTSPFYTPDTFTLSYRELSVFDAALQLELLKWTLYLCRAFPK